MKRNLIMEASLTRILRDYQDTEFALITSWRGDTSPTENRRNLDALKQAVRSFGYGYIRVQGFGQEEDPSGTGIITSAPEPTLLVKNISSGYNPLKNSREFKKDMIKLGRKYNQWGIVFNTPGSGSVVVALKDDYGNQISPKIVDKMSKFSPMKVAQFYTSYKGKPFTLENYGFGYGSKPQNWIQGRMYERDANGNVQFDTYESWYRDIQRIIRESDY